MSASEATPKKSSQKIILVSIILIAAACLCILTLGLGGYFFFGDQIRDLFPGQEEGRISLEKRGSDGDLSGTYQYYSVLGGDTVNFTVSAEGKAIF